MTEKCRITVWRTTEPRDNGGRGMRVGISVRCAEPAVKDGLCWKHLKDRERLS